ncbi:hypothetical protein AB0B12_39915 [Streptomyces sp. NPDC044780]|uniref:hypothetical protein n=1 Tax=unclassified Streptomyces TaxID=2593676 RepID=UPI0034065460
MDLIAAGDEVAARWLDDPQEAVALVRELVAGGEFSEEDVWDEAAGSALPAGLLALREARTTSDPGTAAELCLSAAPHFALAVTLASANLA